MSKSLGNIVDPTVVINGGKDQKKEPPYGADVIRLWAASVDYTGDVQIGKTILAQMSDMSRKIRNTARFLLSNLFDFDPAQDTVTYYQLPESDRYILHRLAMVSRDITNAYDNFEFSRFFQTIQNFCTVDLSNFYLDIAKDRLYISSPDAPRRRSCQTVLMYCLEAITKAIAPVLANTAEDIWQHLPYPVPQKSVFQAGWLVAHDEWFCNHDFEETKLFLKWEHIRELRSEVNKVMEAARNGKLIGAPLEAKVLLVVSDSGLKNYLESFGDELRYLFIASQVEIVETLPKNTQFSSDVILKIRENLPAEDQANVGASVYGDVPKSLQIAVVKADGEKCPRCWNYSTHIGESAEHPHICDRCVGALAGTF